MVIALKTKKKLFFCTKAVTRDDGARNSKTDFFFSL